MRRKPQQGCETPCTSLDLTMQIAVPNDLEIKYTDASLYNMILVSKELRKTHSLQVFEMCGGGIVQIPFVKQKGSIKLQMHFPIMTFIIQSQIGLSLSFLWSLYAATTLLQNKCEAGEDLPPIGLGQVNWWLLGLHIKFSDMSWHPFVLQFVSGTVMRGMLCLITQTKKVFLSASNMWWASPILVMTFLRILCIEMSLYMGMGNPNLVCEPFWQWLCEMWLKL
jgi:hypothetical protein